MTAEASRYSRQSYMTRGCRFVSRRAILLYVFICGLVSALQVLLHFRHSDVKSDTLPGENAGVLGAAGTSGTSLLALSTTLTDVGFPKKRFINRNTLTLWPQLWPDIRPVLYADAEDPCCRDLANSKWSKFAIPEKGGSDLPVLRSMILDSMEKIDADFYGFANGDILFGLNLIPTLKAVKSKLPYLQKPLLVGRRTNVRIAQDLNDIVDVGDIVRKAHDDGELFRHSAEDYFITSKDGFDWQEVPNFVIGRRGFDNWIVAHALNNGYTVIDVTNTVTALHQTGDDGNWAGHRHNDANINMRISGPFNFKKGFLFCVRYQTDFDMYGNVWIRRRSPDSSFC